MLCGKSGSDVTPLLAVLEEQLHMRADAHARISIHFDPTPSQLNFEWYPRASGDLLNNTCIAAISSCLRSSQQHVPVRMGSFLSAFRLSILRTLLRGSRKRLASTR